ncbi:hypothetical protein [Yoonia litorea]|uniref:hypothetical protein n=1 Tax=Yoonia litorea TaxID=1123755 RepID=UPI001F60CC9F|nr:hypothetical protein [Yoonia litorea]
MAAPTLAQNATLDEPLSAIEWLSRSVEEPAMAEPPTAGNATAPDVTTTPLSQPSKDPIGLLPSRVTGLPPDIWVNSNEADLVRRLQAERIDMLPAMQDLLKVLLLAEAQPPKDAGSDDALFLARVDKLLDMGALEQAKSLLEQATPDTPELFRRWFDVGLLTGTEDDACAVLKETPEIAPTYPARIFCQARNGDWSLAALTLNTHRVLGDITPAEEALLSRFLDPELFEGEPALDAPARVSPLTFRMHEAIGEPLATGTLPLAFAHADLRFTAPWRAQLEAAERLARHGAVSENVLLRHYTSRTPAASGGLWDRAAAMQRFDVAMLAGDVAGVSETIGPAWEAMKEARAEIQFAKLYGAALQDMPLTPEAASLAFEIALLSPAYERVALAARQAGSAFDPFLTGVALGAPDPALAETQREDAIAAAFTQPMIPQNIQRMLDEDKLGEALLVTLQRFDAGAEGDLRALTEALSVLREVGLDDVARRAALQHLLLYRGL